MGTDSITGSNMLKNALSQGDAVFLSAEFSAVMTAETELINSLSAMNGLTEQTIIASALSHGGTSDLWGMLSASLSAEIICENTLGSYGLSGGFDISTPLGITGFGGSVLLSMPQTTAYIHTDTLSVYADGRDVTKFLVTAEISLFGESGIPSVTALFSASLTPASLMFVINGEVFIFKIFSRTASREKTEVRGETAKNESKITVNEGAARASQIAVAYSDKIVWAGLDYVLTDVYGEYTAYGLAEMMSAPFHTLRLLPDGYITVSGMGSDVIIEPDTLFSYEITEKQSEYASVTVTYGSLQTYVEADSTVSAGGYGTIKVFGYYGGDITTDADEILLNKKGVTESFSEDVFFTDGIGELKRPPLSIQTPNALFGGTEVRLAGAQGYRRISYTAVYDEYLIYSGTAGKKSAEIYTDSSVTVITGRKGTDISLGLPHVIDRATALICARERAKDTLSAVVTLPRTDGLTLPAGLSFRYERIEGRIVSAKIAISTEPLVIKDIIEVQK